MQSAEFIAIGGGLIGLASAYYYLQTNRDSRVLVLEKEADVAQHQSSHNSNVLHAGIGLRPNSLKAQHVRYGRGMLVEFCRQEKLPIAVSGQVVVAVNSAEIPHLETLHKHAISNGVNCALIDADQLRAIEPHASGIAALHTPDAGVIDYQQIARRLALRIEMAGGRVITNAKVVGMQERPEGVIIQTEKATYIAAHAANAAGLFADRLAHKAGFERDLKILPFRGEYWHLNRSVNHLINTQIFPVPDETLPFSGIHLTKQLDGTILCGPNAILAGSREGYKKGRINLRDSLDQWTSRRVRRLTRQHFSTALWEQRRSWSKELFALTLQRLVPAIAESHLEPAPAGVSPYAITPDGTLLDDFVFAQTERLVHVISVPLPGATASLSIGRTIAHSF